MQYVGHLDLFRAWERTFRRAGLPLEYTRGFHPQPHLNLACALPVGFTSQCELLDAWLEQAFPLGQVQEALSATLSPGLAIAHLQEIDEHAPALQTQVRSVIYLISFLDAVPNLEERLQQLLAKEHLPRVRRDKPYDLRPLIESASLLSLEAGGRPGLSVQLASREAATGRPEELLAEMGINFEDTRVHRQSLILTAD